MVVLVTGANGFLGSYICKELLKAGYSVKALVRESSDRRRLEPLLKDIDIVESDLLDIPQLNRVFENVEVVVHSAAKVSFQKGDCSEILETNVDGTRNIVNLCLHFEITQLVYISSTAALGRNKEEEVLDESAKWSESEFSTCYGKSKYMAELEVWRGQSEGLKVSVLNPSIILGQQTYGNGSGRLFSYLQDEPTYYPSGLVNVVDVRDVAEITVKAIQFSVTGERFILNSTTLSYHALFEKITGHMQKRMPKKRLQQWQWKLAFWGDYFRSLLTGKGPHLSEEIIRNSSSRVSYTTDRARGRFDFQFRSLDESLAWIMQEPLQI